MTDCVTRLDYVLNCLQVEDSSSPTKRQNPERLGVHAPARRVDDDAHQAPRKDAGGGQRDDPAHVDPRHHAPVDRPPRTGAEADADSSASDALRGGYRKLCNTLVRHQLFGHFKRGNSLRRVARITVIAEPSSIENPLDGE